MLALPTKYPLTIASDAQVTFDQIPPTPARTQAYAPGQFVFVTAGNLSQSASEREPPTPTHRALADCLCILHFNENKVPLSMYTMAQAPSKDLHKPTPLPISTVTCHDALQAKNTDRTDFTYNPTHPVHGFCMGCTLSGWGDGPHHRRRRAGGKRGKKLEVVGGTGAILFLPLGRPPQRLRPPIPCLQPEPR